MNIQLFYKIYLNAEKENASMMEGGATTATRMTSPVLTDRTCQSAYI